MREVKNLESRTSFWDLCLSKAYYGTLSEKTSVADTAICQEQGGATSLAGWQALRHKFQIGVHGAGETPVPIPNTAVKPSIGYNTWVLALGK